MFTTLMVVFSFAGQKIRIAFQSTHEGWIRRVTGTTFLFKLSKFGFYNIFFVILNKIIRIDKTTENTKQLVVERKKQMLKNLQLVITSGFGHINYLLY